MDELINKIAAFIEGPVRPRVEVGKVPVELQQIETKKRPDHGQGDVKREDDKRLKENKERAQREKEHSEMRRKVTEDEQSAGEDRDVEKAESHEETEVKVPYERERVDHRAALTGTELATEKGLPMDKVPGHKALPKLAPTMVSKIPQKAPESPMNPELQRVLNHPVHGPYVHQLLGPNPQENAHLLPQVYEKMKNRSEMAVAASERDELQGFISLVAAAIVKTAQ